jgi:hypothetical protein
LYSDNESKIARLKRVLILIIVLAAINTFFVFNNINLLNLVTDSGESPPIIIMVLWGLSIAVILLLIFTAIKIIRKMKKIERSIHE